MEKCENTFGYFKGIFMAKICQVTGKKPMSGNNVSHAHNKTRRRFFSTFKPKNFGLKVKNKWVRLRVSAKGLRIIDKNGIDSVLKELKA